MARIHSDFILLYTGRNIISAKNAGGLSINEMKYFLFVSFNSSLNHNALYDSLIAVQESLEQLVEGENLNLKFEEIPSAENLDKHFVVHEDYYGGLSNGTWFHIQQTTGENILKTFRPEMGSLT